MQYRLPKPMARAIDLLAVPLCVFGVVFLAAIIGMTRLLTPDRFPARIGDKVVLLGNLTQEEQSLQVREQNLLTEQESLDGKVPTPVLNQLNALRAESKDAGSALVAVDDVRQSFALSGESPISVQRIWFNQTEKRLAIAGAVRDPSGRSMQILASFVDNLRSSGTFERVSEPEYVQQADIDGVSLSPFSISLFLAQ